MTRSNSKSTSTPIHYSYWIIAALAGMAIVWLLVLWNSVPKLQASDDALKTVDALFTAINSHDSKRVAECKSKLERYSSDGGISKTAMAELARCCEQAQAADWERAAKRLYILIQKQ